MAATVVDDLEPDTSLTATARAAGLLYLVAIVLGPFSLIYVPSVIVVLGNAAATADNIRSHELLLRLGIVGDVATGTVFLFVVLALYQLLKDVWCGSSSGGPGRAARYGIVHGYACGIATERSPSKVRRPVDQEPYSEETW